MSAENLPDPLVPPEVDLRDFGFMPLDVLRLRDSDLATVATGDEFKAAVLLWSTAWHQIPSSSVPDDDRWFAKHSGAGPRWRKVRAEALRGFVLCSDGRRYHPVVAEKAAEGWNGKLEAEHKRACDRARKTNKEREQQKLEALPMPVRPRLLTVRTVGGFPCWRYWDSGGTQTDSSGNSSGIPDDGLRKSRLKGEGEVRDSEGTGRGKGKENPEGQTHLSGSPPDALTLDGNVPPKKPNGAACYPDAEDVLGYLNKSTGKGFEFRNRNGDLTASADMIVQRLRQGYTREELREVVHAKCEQWLHNDEMHEYLRPETLFAKRKFEQYLGELKGAGNG